MGDSTGTSAFALVTDRAKQLAGVVTASGFAALLYGAGYIAVNRAGETFGVPDRTLTQGAYVRGGYLFALQSAAVLIEVLRGEALLLGGVIVVAVIAYRLLPSARI